MTVKSEHEVFFQQANEEIRKFYQESQLDYVPTAEHRAHAEFAAKSQNRPIKRHIAQIHRVRAGGLKGDENVYFKEVYSSKDHRGNKIEKSLVNGKYEKPVGLYQYDELRGDNICIGIADLETVYQIPFDIKNLDDMVENGEIDGTTQYYVETPGGRMYGGFEYEDFRTLPFEDLIHLGKTGFHPEEKQLEVKTKDKKIPTGLKE
jgi:hypothetical protein